MTDRDAQPLAEIVGKTTRSLRERHGITRDELARAARARGLTWSTGSVAAIEAGKSSLSLPQLLVLCDALHQTTGRAYRLSELLKGGSESHPDHLDVQLTPSVAVSSGAIASWLGGSPVDSLVSGEAMTAQSLVDEVLTESKDWPRAKVLPSEERSARRNAEALFGRRGPTLTARRAAARLGFDTQTLYKWSVEIWGHSFDDEMSRRVDRDASPQKKGHVTRVLLREVEDAYRSQKSKSWQRQNPPITRG